MIVRMAVCVGLIALGYYIGREIGRTESIRDQLREARGDEDLAPTTRDSQSAVS